MGYDLQLIQALSIHGEFRIVNEEFKTSFLHSPLHEGDRDIIRFRNVKSTRSFLNSIMFSTTASSFKAATDAFALASNCRHFLLF